MDDEEQLTEDKNEAGAAAAGGDPLALEGSRGSEYGKNADLLYNQFELLSIVAKKNQIILLQARHLLLSSLFICADLFCGGCWLPCCHGYHT